MKQFAELEKKVLQVIQSNKDLRERNDLLQMEIDDLKKECAGLKYSLDNSSQMSRSFENEKQSLKGSIKELLDNINSLESKNKEIIK